jgi:hypothetical protein
MPIRPELRHHYRGRAWRETRARILERAGNLCEACGVKNRSRVVRVAGFWFNEAENHWINPLFVHLGHLPTTSISWENARMVDIVLTIAHLNHQPGDDRDENLKALCQWCHLHYDVIEHTRNAALTRRTRKDQARPLLVLLEEAC